MDDAGGDIENQYYKAKCQLTAAFDCQQSATDD
jgi:hypothetical protein